MWVGTAGWVQVAPASLSRGLEGPMRLQLWAATAGWDRVSQLEAGATFAVTAVGSHLRLGSSFSAVVRDSRLRGSRAFGGYSSGKRPGSEASSEYLNKMAIA